MLQDFFGTTAPVFGDVASSAFNWMTERDKAKYEAEWRRIQAMQAADIAAAYGAASTAQVAITQATSQRTMTALLVVAAVLILFRIRPTAND